MSFLDRITEGWRKNRKPGYYENFDYHWAMTIDLDQCSGCGACVTACQAENNLPIVGEDAFVKGREVKWLRLEHYWEGEYPDVKLNVIPMMCQHCDSAPCETVCPVSATYHNQDGLNTQIYNRCIGTRSCAVYCPYEVRYFNYNDHAWDSPLDQQLNPDALSAFSAPAKPRTTPKMMAAAEFEMAKYNLHASKRVPAKQWFLVIETIPKAKYLGRSGIHVPTKCWMNSTPTRPWSISRKSRPRDNHAG